MSCLRLPILLVIVFGFSVVASSGPAGAAPEARIRSFETPTDD